MTAVLSVTHLVIFVSIRPIGQSGMNKSTHISYPSSAWDHSTITVSIMRGRDHLELAIQVDIGRPQLVVIYNMLTCLV